ncbi:hypothetical protein BD626DRAFT_475395 [Schizophyllum amplum]|uniref:Uncharacterized protein n=1 Tax=Schizophyllum amplum TaxID=97359 RepID=A0A550CYI1_9AGAR|nr:hypothetical protein BD626DRAFT_475395 [Auriculariopsis ampla]
MLRYFWTAAAFVLSWKINNDAGVSPSDCLTASTFSALAACYADFTVPADFYDATTYAAAQPTAEEATAFRAAVMRMLDVSSGSGNCFGSTLPPALEGIYGVHSFTDSESGGVYCVLAETHAKGTYARGWGFMAVPDTSLSPLAQMSSQTHQSLMPSSPQPSSPSLGIHLSAPHPIFDGDTDLQAATLFAKTRSRSLFIAGRDRRAYKAPTDCVSRKSSAVYYATDPAHSVTEPFHLAQVAIKDWQDAHGGCPHATCAYIQLHGKASTSCSQDTAFISSGLGRDDDALNWYSDYSRNLPARRLQATLADAFPSWNVSLPTDSGCTLLATKTVFGRYVNGVPAWALCDTDATVNGATGEFIHVEQAIESRREDAYEMWGTALRETFAGPGV